MRKSTQQRYQRIQTFYRLLSKAKLSHEFCLQIIADFFCMKNTVTPGVIIQKDLGEMEPYENEDLDKLWIDARIRKHLEEIAPVIELNNQELKESTEL